MSVNEATMKIDHIALWTHNLEQMRAFYEMYFNAQAGHKYHNPRTNFESYFLSFDSGTRLELMQMPNVPRSQDDVLRQFTGYIHLAMSVGSAEDVDLLTNRLRGAGYRVLSAPRVTGDGYYESIVLDPDGNRVEITI